MRFHHDQPVLLRRKTAHVSIRLPVVQGNGRQIVERSVEIVSHIA